MVEIGHVVALAIGLVLGAWLWPKVKSVFVSVQSRVASLEDELKRLKSKL